MPTQSKPVASSPAAPNRRVKRSTVQPLRVTVHYLVHYLSFPAIKRTVPSPPPWLTNGAYGR
jgi:hypothetical protein